MQEMVINVDLMRSFHYSLTQVYIVPSQLQKASLKIQPVKNLKNLDYTTKPQ